MVFFFTCIDPRFILYMGVDKHENEHLIEHGWPTDVWFHVDNLSSAHVYLRMPPDMRIEDIPAEVIEDCCQLVKANSIQGCKLNNVPVVYTPWSNLKKTADMDVGQVGFHKGKLVRRTHVTKDKEIVKRLNKTKEERFPDLAAEKAEYEAGIRRAEKARRREERAAKERAKEEKRQQDELKAYTSLMVEDEMTSNKHGQSYEEFEDDFM